MPTIASPIASPSHGNRIQLPGMTLRRAESDIPTVELPSSDANVQYSNAAFPRESDLITPTVATTNEVTMHVSTISSPILSSSISSQPLQPPTDEFEHPSVDGSFFDSNLVKRTTQQVPCPEEGDHVTKPHYGRLESTPSRDNSEGSDGIIAEFAKGNKSLTIVASKDIKNRWLVSFSYDIFMEMFFIHMFGPFAVPYIYYRYGWIMVQNLSLLELKPPAGFGTWTWCMWVAMNGLYWSSTPNIISTPEVVITTCIFLARNCIIAAKYAYFSPGHLADVTRRRLTAEEVTASLVIAGWFVPTQKTIKTELEYALKRTHVDLRHLYFSFGNDQDEAERIQIAKKLHAGFDELMKEGNRCEKWEDKWLAKIGEGEVPGHLVCVSLLNEAVNSLASSASNYPRYAMLSGLLHALIPSLWRLGTSPETTLGETPSEFFIIFFAFVVAGFNTFANLMFVLVGIVDYDRRVYLMHQCSAMVTATYKIWQTGKSQLMPCLNFEKASNVANWLDLRMVLKDFGLHYFMRIQIYASLWVFFVVAFLVYLFSQLVTRTTQTTSIILVCYDLFILLVALFYMVQSAISLNQQHVEHKRILLQKLSLLQRQISKATTVSALGEPLDLSPTKLEELRNAKEMLIVAIQVMDHEDIVSPVRILGFAADTNFLRGMLATGGSALIAAGKLILFN